MAIQNQTKPYVMPCGRLWLPVVACGHVWAPAGGGRAPSWSWDPHDCIPWLLPGRPAIQNQAKPYAIPVVTCVACGHVWAPDRARRGMEGPHIDWIWGLHTCITAHTWYLTNLLSKNQAKPYAIPCGHLCRLQKPRKNTWCTQQLVRCGHYVFSSFTCPTSRKSCWST